MGRWAGRVRTRAIACYVEGDYDYASAVRYAVQAIAKRPDWFLITTSAQHATQY